MLELIYDTGKLGKGKERKRTLEELIYIINNKEEWEVEDILDGRSHWGKIQYWVKWIGWDEDWEWYNASGFNNSLKIIEDFYTRYPNKPQP